MKNILVTGGTGYIGSHTVVELIQAGFHPVVVDDFSNSHPEMKGRIEQIIGQELILEVGNCTDASWISEVMKKHAIDGVIHFAAFKAVGESVAEPLKYYQNNLNSLLQILIAMEENDVNNLVFSSSCTVYGSPEGTAKVDEQTPLAPPNSPYGWTKWMCEQIIKDTCAANPLLNVVTLRYFNPIGAHSSALIGEFPQGIPNNIVPFMTQTAAGIRSKLTVFGSDYPTNDGTCIRDYIHVVDLALAHIQSLRYLKENKGLSVFNIGTGKGTSVLELIAAFELATGKSLSWEYGARRSGDVTEIYADATKANTHLNWKAERNVEQAIQDAWEWELGRG